MKRRKVCWNIKTLWLPIAIALILAANVAPVGGSGSHNYNNQDCDEIHYISDPAEQCDFVTYNENCAIESGYIHYTKELYCTFQDDVATVFAYILYVLLFLYYLIAIALSSDRIFVPNLQALATAMRLSENVAGETLLPLGNGAADIFTSIAAAISMQGGDISVLYGTLLGSGAFTTTVIVGAIVAVKPFHSNQRPLLRVMIFYLLAVYTAFTVAWDGVIDAGEASIFLVLYVVYLASVIAGPRVNTWLIEWARERNERKKAEVVIASPPAVTKETLVTQIVPDKAEELPVSTKAPNEPVQQTSHGIEIVIEDENNQQVPLDADRKSDSTNEGEVFQPDVAPADTQPQQHSLAPRNSTSSRLLSLELPSSPRRSKAVTMNEKTSKELKEAAATAAAKKSALERLSSAPTKRTSDPTHNSSQQHPHHHHHHAQPQELEGLSRVARLLIRQQELREMQYDELRGSFRRRRLSSSVKRKSVKQGAQLNVGQEPVAAKPSVLEAFLMPDSSDSSSSDDEEVAADRNDQLRKSKRDNGDFELEVVSPRQNAVVGVAPDIIDEVQEEAAEDEKPAEEDIADRPIWRWLLDGLNPIDVDTWATDSWLVRLLQIVRSPVYIAILLTTPVLDNEKPMRNWNRPLNAIHCITVPVFFIVAVNAMDLMIAGVFPVIALFGLVGCMFSFLVLLFSENTKAPSYHIIFAVLSLISTAMWIYMFANEIINLIYCFGITLNIDEGLLGLTFLAWGNCLPDFINDLTVAKQGYSKMALSASFGSALFNMLIGLGVPLLIVTFNGPLQVELPNILYIMFIFMFSSLSCSLIAIVILQRFHLRMPYAIFLFVIYVAILAFVIVVVVNE